MFDRTNITLISDVDQDTYRFGSQKIPNLSIYNILAHTTLDLKRDKTKIRTQQYIQLNTRAIEIKQLNPGGSDHRHNIRRQPSQL